MSGLLRFMRCILDWRRSGGSYNASLSSGLLQIANRHSTTRAAIRAASTTKTSIAHQVVRAIAASHHWLSHRLSTPGLLAAGSGYLPRHCWNRTDGTPWRVGREIAGRYPAGTAAKTNTAPIASSPESNNLSPGWQNGELVRVDRRLYSHLHFSRCEQSFLRLRSRCGSCVETLWGYFRGCRLRSRWRGRRRNNRRVEWRRSVANAAVPSKRHDGRNQPTRFGKLAQLGPTPIGTSQQTRRKVEWACRSS